MQGQWCLDRNQHQGHYGEAFVQALAAAAGLQVAKPQPDCTGVDLQLTVPSEYNGDFPQIQVQVKSWSVPKERDDSWRYHKLNEMQFDALAGRRIWPRYLFLVVVPGHSDEYAVASTSSLALAHAAYWVSLADEPRLEHPSRDRHRTVSVPKGNLLTVRTLQALFDSVMGGGGT
ncbi:DUF4365 domain-containing protein [Nocardia wallacei]|uniref:DUF4365 domain-containing protein n=1 Tax=Nocardia wallacei TaxID=480035 RepID=UPI002458C3A2|nr:DUF4365 domain-containing protein [Nocardia wallacei]